MNIVLSLAIALASICFIGFGITGFLSRRLPLPEYSLVAVTGYALSQIVFFPAYFLLPNPSLAVWAVFALAATINMAYLWPFFAGWRQWRELAPGMGWIKNIPARSLLFASILLLAAWPYLLSGWGNYWHTGNEDIMDALHGRDSYLSQTLKTGDFDIGVRVRDVAQEQFKLLTGFWSDKLTAARIIDRYSTGVTRLQYSSVAFWSVLLDAHHKMDAYLIQALINLILMAQGVYLVARLSLAMPNRIAILGSLAAVLSNFYLTTYFNGHEGSMMYNAVAPFLLVLGLAWIKSVGWSWKVAILPAIWLLFVANSYPYPLPFLLLPLAAYWLYRKVIFPRYLSGVPSQNLIYRGALVAIVVIAVAYWAAWGIFEPARLTAASKFRSWQTVFNYVGFFQYWGIWQSNLANSGNILEYLIQAPWVIWLSGMLSIGLTVLALVGFRFAWRTGYRFFGFWLAMWLLFFPLMRYVVGDPYYFYKFLYLNGFVIWLMAVFAAWKIFQRANKFSNMVLICLLGITGLLNLANDVIAGRYISDKLYNRSARYYDQVATIPTAQLALAFIDIPQVDVSDVVRQVVAAANLKTEADIAKAKYLLRLEGARDAVNEEEGQTIWRSEIFRLVEAPAHNLVHLVSYWEPEHELSGVRALPFRWVSDARISAFTVWVIRPDSNAKYLHFCAESGPSMDFRPLTIAARDGNRNLLGDYVVEGYSCHWVPVQGKVGPFSFSSDAQGRTISPIEPRKLNYRIFMVGLSDRVNDESTVATLTLANDIVRKDNRVSENAPAKLQLGNGWYNFESFAGESFRWAKNNAEIVLFRRSRELQRLELDVEPGPALGNKPLSLQILDARGLEIASALVTGRQTLNLDIPPGNEASQLLCIHAANTDNLAVSNDPRILNFRVFRIGVVSAANP